MFSFVFDEFSNFYFFNLDFSNDNVYFVFLQKDKSMLIIFTYFNSVFFRAQELNMSFTNRCIFTTNNTLGIV